MNSTPQHSPARVTASTLADMYSAVVTAIGALEGPLHGGANEQAMTMLRDIGSPEGSRGMGERTPGEKRQDHGVWASGL